MRARAVAAAALALLVVTLAAMPGAAVAKGKYFVIPAQRLEAIQHLRAAYGFSFTLVSSGKKVWGGVDKRIGGEGFEDVTYTGEREGPGESGFHLDLGREGRIDLHFVAHKVTEERLSQYCKGKASVTEFGDFVGALHLHGLRGFTRIDRGSVPGTIYRGGRQVCRRRKEPGVDGVGIGVKGKGYVPTGTGVIAASTTAADPTFFAFARTIKFGTETIDQTNFSSAITEAEGDASVTRSSSVAEEAEAGLRQPAAGDPLDTTTVEPPAPFSGSASFELLAPRKAEWSGDLAVELPGLGTVPLTGPGIEAGFCRDGKCTKTLPKRLHLPS